VEFDFLTTGANYTATICLDGINADRYAADYALSNGQIINQRSSMKIHVAPGGGFLIKLSQL
jgi:alpha-glucosidase